MSSKDSLITSGMSRYNGKIKSTDAVDSSVVNGNSRIRPRSTATAIATATASTRTSNDGTSTGSSRQVAEEFVAEGAEAAHYVLQEGVRFLIGFQSFLLSATTTVTDTTATSSTATSTSPPVMVTIPAAAMDWLEASLHLLMRKGSNPKENAHANDGTGRISSSSSYMEHLIRLRNQLLLDLKPLIAKVTHLQIIGTPWPNNSDSSFTSHCPYTHPRINVQLFPSVQVLILDAIPPEWLILEQTIASQLTLFKVQRACVYDVYSLFHRTSFHYFPTLTHLRLSECAIGELSGLVFETSSSPLPQCCTDTPTTTSTTPASEVVTTTPPIFSQMPNLKSIHLSKNQIIRVETAVAGFKSLLKLQKVDLSYNYIKSFHNAHHYLGENLHTLLLSHNHLTSVEGIDHLYSLCTLALDHNYISTFTEVARLAYNLPQLMNLALQGNPLWESTQQTLTNMSDHAATATTYTANYRRLDVWNIFWEARSNEATEDNNFRNFSLSSVFPVLDGQHITTREWSLLKQKGIFWERISTIHIDNGTKGHHDTNGYTKGSNCSASNATTSTASSSITNYRETSILSYSSNSSRRYVPKVTRRNHTRLAKIKNKKSFDDVVDTRHNSKTLMLNESAVEEMIHNSDRSKQPYQLHHVIAAMRCTGEEENNLIKRSESITSGHVADWQTVKQNFSSSNCNNSSYKRRKERSKALLLSIFEEAASNEKYYDYSTEGTDASSTTAPMNTATSHLLNPSLPALTSKITGNTLTTKSTENLASFVAVDDVAGATPKINTKKSSKDDPFHSIYHDNVKANTRSNVPQDNKGIENQLYTKKSEVDLKKKKREADRVSYDGLEELGALPVSPNHLELYYKQFILCGKNNLRIRLRESDKSSVNTTHQQSFVGLWRDLSVIPCGKAAISRLGAHIVSRRGFHGNALPSTFVACEKQHIIVLSDVALYFIPAQEDNVAPATNPVESTTATSTRRKFPSPIPQGALFQDGWLPHSAATHGLIHLKRMTIGFGFQRLTLHFVIPNHTGTKLDNKQNGRATDVIVFCYVIFTCNKKKCIEILQQLQAKAKEAVKQRYHRDERLYDDDDDKIGTDGPFIDNDDKLVLDSLHSVNNCENIKMNQVGTVVHYQIVHQKWKSVGRSLVRRVCVVTDENILLLDEDYFGDGCEYSSSRDILGSVRLQPVDIASLCQVIEICASNEDPCAFTLVIRKGNRSKVLSSIKPDHKWRIICSDGESAESLVDEVRRAKIYRTLPSKASQHL